MKNRIFLAVVAVVLAALTAPGAPKGKSSAALKAKPQAALKVKSGNYTPGSKLTRREFVEKTFGVKFGEELDKSFTIDEQTKIDCGINMAHKKLSSPVCGLKDALFRVSQQNELVSVDLFTQNPNKRVSSGKAAAAKLDQFSKEVGKWLGITDFGPQETVDRSDKAWRLMQSFSEDDLVVEISVVCKEQSKTAILYGCGITISFNAPEAKVLTDEEAAAQSAQASSGNPPPRAATPSAPDPEEEKARAERERQSAESKATEARMKKIILPSVRFGPPATIIDAVDFFKAAAKQHDDPKLPPEKRGFNFILSGVSDGIKIPELPQIDESNISLWDALGKVCMSCGWKFEVEGKMVIVMPKGKTAKQLLTRGIHVDEAALDAKAGTAGIKGFDAKAAKWQAWLESQGVEWPGGSRMLYVQAVGKLRVTNTEDNLDKIEKLLAK